MIHRLPCPVLHGNHSLTYLEFPLQSRLLTELAGKLWVESVRESKFNKNKLFTTHKYYTSPLGLVLIFFVAWETLRIVKHCFPRYDILPSGSCGRKECVVHREATTASYQSAARHLCTRLRFIRLHHHCTRSSGREGGAARLLIKGTQHLASVKMCSLDYSSVDQKYVIIHTQHYRKYSTSFHRDIIIIVIIIIIIITLKGSFHAYMDQSYSPHGSSFLSALRMKSLNNIANIKPLVGIKQFPKIKDSFSSVTLRISAKT